MTCVKHQSMSIKAGWAIRSACVHAGSFPPFEAHSFQAVVSLGGGDAPSVYAGSLVFFALLSVLSSRALMFDRPTVVPKRRPPRQRPTR